MLTSAQILSVVKATLDAHEPSVLGIVYGSTAAATLRDDSDVDIAVLQRSAMTAEERAELISTLGRRLQ